MRSNTARRVSRGLDESGNAVAHAKTISVYLYVCQAMRRVAHSRVALKRRDGSARRPLQAVDRRCPINIASGWPQGRPNQYKTQGAAAWSNKPAANVGLQILRRGESS